MPSTVKLILRRRARRQRQRHRAGRQQVVGLVTALLVLVGGIMPLSVVSVVSVSAYNEIVADFPAPQATIFLDGAVGASAMYDRTGTRLLWSIDDPLGDQRQWVELDDLPPYLLTATLLSEDPDFLTDTRNRQPAFILTRIAENALYGPLNADGTLAGRLVRNVLAPPPDVITASYRNQEYVLVAEVSRRHAPEDILEWHLNTAYYGGDAYGIDAAAQVYFGKPAAALTVDEAAMLAAIPPAPEFNPADDLVAARGRQAALLRELFINNAITQEQYNTANETVTLVRADAGQIPAFAPDYAIYAREQAEDILDGLGYDGSRLVSRGGLRIITALDVTIYEQATCTLENHLTQLNGGAMASPDVCVGVGYLPAVSAAGSAVTEGAAVVIDVRSGELLAAVGDVAAQTRQPGVILYPFAYMKGFSSSLYTPATMVLDIPQRFPGAADGLIYTPENPDNSFFGPVNLRDAMGAYRLPPVVAVANRQGLDNILRDARLIGMRGLDPNAYDLSLLERGGSVSVLDATYAYTVFGSLGEMRGAEVLNPARGLPPRAPAAVLRIEDAAGNILWDYADPDEIRATPILDHGLAYLVNHVLSDTSTRVNTLGSGNFLETPRPAAIIAGAAGGNTGAWSIGYTPNLAVGVWVGGGRVSLDPYSITGAAPVWRALTDYSHDRLGLGPDSWVQPGNIMQARVCERSGLRPNGSCPERTEIFLENTQPPDIDTYWQQVTVNTQTNQLATANTPATFREERRYFVPPAEAAEWWAATQPVSAQLPDEYDTITRPDVVRSTIILRPETFEYVRGTVDVRGSVDGDTLQYYQVAYGAGLNPSEWTDITGQRTDYTPGTSLATWDTSGLNGLYNLRLTAVLEDNSIDPYIVQVTVDNIPPTITLTAGEPGQVFTFLDNDVIPLQAEAVDNVAINRVEFYTNGEFVGTDETFPFGYEHNITRAGEEVFTAVVFDAAGNQTSTELTVEILRGGT